MLYSRVSEHFAAAHIDLYKMLIGLNNFMIIKKCLRLFKLFFLNIIPTLIIKINVAVFFFCQKKDCVSLCYHRALDWIKINTVPGKGIISNSFHNERSHPEVTGYLIPTLIDAGEFKLAEQYADFLCEVQRANGSFSGPDGKEEYVFDSAQALRGLLSACRIWSRFKRPAEKTADYVLSAIEDNGRIPPSYQGTTDRINVFILPILITASEIIGNFKYSAFAKKSLAYYKNIPDILDENILSHDLAYIIDGFIDMEESEFIRSFVEKFFLAQPQSGKILAFPNVSWSCSAGAAQFAVIAYKLGMKENGNKILKYLCGRQNYSGGFYGSFGIFGNYFNDVEIGWANKFFIDAVHLRLSFDKKTA